MTSEQRLVAWISTLLVLFAIYRLYRPYLSQILFDTPPGEQGITASIGSLVGNTVSGIANQAVKAGESQLSPLNLLKDFGSALSHGSTTFVP